MYFSIMKRFLLFLPASLMAIHGFSQDFDWWNTKHNYDGVSSWMKYIIYSPSYMGPNSLPVPDVSKGYFDENFYISPGAFYHYSEGDKTFNFMSHFNLPLAPGRAGVMVSYMPVEFYQMDTITRDIRRARDYDPDGYSLGDFYFTTYLQIIKGHKNLPDIMMSINLKTTSGTNLKNARNTDAPGYYFDVSASKKIEIEKEKLKWLRPYGMAGFYNYQTNCYKYTQNDAFLFGIGTEIGFNKFRIDTEIGGYIGYFDLGDKPIVYRLEYRSLRKSGPDYSLVFQTGINDFQYTSFGFSVLFTYRAPDWLGSKETKITD